MWSLSYLSTKYSRIARVSLGFDQPSTGGDRRSEDLPNDDVVIVVVNDGRDATVRVDLQVVWTLVLCLAEVEVDRFVRQPEFLKDDDSFPESRVSSQTVVTFEEGGSKHASRWVRPCGCTT